MSDRHYGTSGGGMSAGRRFSAGSLGASYSGYGGQMYSGGTSAARRYSADAISGGGAMRRYSAGAVGGGGYSSFGAANHGGGTFSSMSDRHFGVSGGGGGGAGRFAHQGGSYSGYGGQMYSGGGAARRYSADAVSGGGGYSSFGAASRGGTFSSMADRQYGISGGGVGGTSVTVGVNSGNGGAYSSGTGGIYSLQNRGLAGFVDSNVQSQSMSRLSQSGGVGLQTTAADFNSYRANAGSTTNHAGASNLVLNGMVGGRFDHEMATGDQLTRAFQASGIGSSGAAYSQVSQGFSSYSSGGGGYSSFGAANHGGGTFSSMADRHYGVSGGF
eukprot:NODE_226_length_1138_cov_315.137488_g221_i0.p1 GENE.NODE_226_length_1138_cov_315.137488_g221_i0~~NODE_226_length_1138_cov_315.137488_g221_i0.p1  ORF type:complete len:347 (+),score=103.73 NODE_226_length_1138_cov_315.137488_g221_i0:57-1043(+)